MLATSQRRAIGSVLKTTTLDRKLVRHLLEAFHRATPNVLFKTPP